MFLYLYILLIFLKELDRDELKCTLPILISSQIIKAHKDQNIKVCIYEYYNVYSQVTQPQNQVIMKLNQNLVKGKGYSDCFKRSPSAKVI